MPRRLPHDAGISGESQRSPTPAPLLPSKFPRIADFARLAAACTIHPLRLSRAAPALGALPLHPGSEASRGGAGLVLGTAAPCWDQHWFPNWGPQPLEVALQPEIRELVLAELNLQFGSVAATRSAYRSGRQAGAARPRKNSPAPTRSSLSRRMYGRQEEPQG